MVRDRIITIVLALGAVSGFSAGIAAHAHHRHHHRQRVMNHVARTCVQAARDLDAPAQRAVPNPSVAAPQFVTVPVYVPVPQPAPVAP